MWTKTMKVYYTDFVILGWVCCWGCWDGFVGVCEISLVGLMMMMLFLLSVGLFMGVVVIVVIDFSLFLSLSLSFPIILFLYIFLTPNNRQFQSLPKPILHIQIITSVSITLYKFMLYILSYIYWGTIHDSVCAWLLIDC